MSDVSEINKLRKIVEEQRSTILELKDKVSMALKVAEAAENYTRLDCLVLRGTKAAPLLNTFRKGVSLRTEVTRLFRELIGISLEQWHLNTVHWDGFGKAIIVRFNNKEIRHQIYRNRVPKDKTKRGILIIHESLSKETGKIIKMVTKLRKTGEISSYWTQQGQVFIRRKLGAPAIHVMSDWTEEELMKQLQNQPNTYLEAAQARQDIQVSTNTVKSSAESHVVKKLMPVPVEQKVGQGAKENGLLNVADEVPGGDSSLPDKRTTRSSGKEPSLPAKGTTSQKVMAGSGHVDKPTDEAGSESSSETSSDKDGDETESSPPKDVNVMLNQETPSVPSNVKVGQKQTISPKDAKKKKRHHHRNAKF